jgi:hypothetical protein
MCNVPAKPAAAPVNLESIEKKIEAQRERLFQAMSMIATVNKVLGQNGEVGDEAEESPLWFALGGVHGMLNSINEKLDEIAMMTRVREVAHVAA